MEWEPLGSVEPAALIDARIQLHHAAQHLAAVGASLAQPAPDASHKAFTYDLERRVLRGVAIGGAWHAALDLGSFRLLLLQDGAVAATLDLPGRTDVEVLTWLNDHARPLGAATVVTPHRYDEDFPVHAVGAGAAYGLGAGHPHLVELDRYFANTARVLEVLRAREARASPARVWPHHLDLATLILLDESSGEDARSVGVGFSPGDAATPEPYWYVTPWPPGSVSELPKTSPGGGVWQAQPFYDAVLRAGALPEGGAGTSEAPEGFVAAGLAQARALLRGAPGA